MALDVRAVKKIVVEHRVTSGWGVVPSGDLGPGMLPTRFFVEDPGQDEHKRKSRRLESEVMKSLPKGERTAVNKSNTPNFVLNRAVDVKAQASRLAVPKLDCVLRVEALCFPITGPERDGESPLAHPTNRMIFGGPEAIEDYSFRLPSEYRDFFVQTGVGEAGGLWELPFDGPEVPGLEWERDVIEDAFYGDEAAMTAVLDVLSGFWEGEAKFEEQKKRTSDAGSNGSSDTTT